MQVATGKQRQQQEQMEILKYSAVNVLKCNAEYKK